LFSFWLNHTLEFSTWYCGLGFSTWYCGLQVTGQVVLNLINQRVDQLNHLIGQLHITEVLYCTMQSQAFPLRMGTVCHQTYYLYHTNMLAVIILYTSRVRMVNSEHI